MEDRGLVEDALSCQARGQVLCSWLAREEASKQASSGEWKATRAEVLQPGVTINSAAIRVRLVMIWY